MSILGPMASAPIQRTYLTAEEYLELERGSEMKHELLDGEMVAMTGGSPEHALIIANLLGELRGRLKRSSRPCRVYSGDLRVRASVDAYVYPDAVVVCGDPLVEDSHRDTLLNPILIVEVLSPSTESYDRGRKFEHYQMLDSLKEYVLVAQDRPRIEHYLRQDGHVWLYTEVSGLEGSVSLPSLGCEVPLSEIYDQVAFAG